jgi:predicted DsbA family dithiol-disulfide isomerase
MNKRIKIDFVSDISCPWCVIGLKSLEEAPRRVGDQVRADMRFQPFELNPRRAAAGEDIPEHLKERYGATAEQSGHNREAIRARGAEVGYRFKMDKRDRVYNTFDAHRLLHWAGLEGRQQALKHAFFEAYFSAGKNPSDRDVLVDIVAAVGLNGARAPNTRFEPVCRGISRTRTFLPRAGRPCCAGGNYQRSASDLGRSAGRRL